MLSGNPLGIPPELGDVGRHAGYLEIRGDTYVRQTRRAYGLMGRGVGKDGVQVPNVERGTQGVGARGGWCVHCWCVGWRGE